MKKVLFVLICITALVWSGCDKKNNPAKSRVDVSSVTLATLDNVTEKCWYYVCDVTLEGVSASMEVYTWGTEREAVVDAQQTAKGLEEELTWVEAKNYSVRCTYAEAEAASKGACMAEAAAAEEAYKRTFSCWEIIRSIGNQSQTIYRWCNELQCKISQMIDERNGYRDTYKAADADDEVSCLLRNND